MISTLSHDQTARPVAPTGGLWAPVFAFTVAVLRASLKNRAALAGTLFTPLFMLAIFALVTPRAKPGAFDMLAFIFPGIIAFTVTMAGSGQVMRLGSWRQQGVFDRLACTPVPLGMLVLGASGAAVLLGLIQAVLVLAFGVVAFGLVVAPLGVLGAVGVLTLGGACFIAYGSLVSSLVPRLEVANLVFIFTLLPMAFLGNTFMPSAQMPSIVQTIGPWLPTTLIADLTRALLAGSDPAHGYGLPVLGLLAYTALFSLSSARLFRAEA